ncbi:EAL domain-containing protein [Pararobbsia silviterrae]|uniref:EAL domain-containing protein n=1 Tax=Pararobbsia silviterrae TaxID=1792498 RepID=A0A494XG27_9BURK|nr:EAL domain-containing protein [Pararobbsia silviterrae]RKP46543.1 EAL domain-containing protein [Pararobbsia silviterrae]
MRNPFVRLLARLSVGRKLLLIYLLDLTAVIYISGILIHEKYIAIDFAQKEIAGNVYVSAVRGGLIDIARVGAGESDVTARLRAFETELSNAEAQHGADMHSDDVSAGAIASVSALVEPGGLLQTKVDAAIGACRELITRVGNQSNLILDPDLDSYYTMSLLILRYPALIQVTNGIGERLHASALRRTERNEARTRYLILEGQLDATTQGFQSDFNEAVAANPGLERALGPAKRRMFAAVDAYREAARTTVDTSYDDPRALAQVDDAQRALVDAIEAGWQASAVSLDGLLHARVHELYMRMWLHLGTALSLLCGILCMVYFVAGQIARPLRTLARVMETVRRTGDHSRRAIWNSQDEIGRLVLGFNGMLEQLDREREAQKERAASARASEAQHALVEATPFPMVVTAIPGHEVLHANQPAARWLDGLETDPWGVGLDSSVRARFFQQLSDRGAVDEFEVRWKAGGEPAWAVLSARRLQFQGRDAILTAFAPINHLKVLEQRLELWAKVFEGSSEAILIVDSDRRVLTVNPAFYRATGYDAADVLGKSPQFLAANPPGGDTFDTLAASATRRGAWQGETRIRKRNGETYPAWLMVSLVREKQGDVSYYICTSIDISDRKKSEARIEFLAHHDVLTELPNRALCTERLGVAMARAQETGERVALLFIDLDRFKNINDSLGHHVGDALLRSVAGRLSRSVRANDTVSRLGGDEFIVILDGVAHREDVSRMVDQTLIPWIREPHDVDGSAIHVSCSVGIAMYPDDGRDIDDLLQHADVAMYVAKESGGNVSQFFSADMTERVRSRMTLEAHLREALDDDAFELVYQPYVDAQTGQLVGVEGLLRWHNAELGDVPPGRFIPIAEETRLIIPIGAWVIDRACRQMAQWREDGLGDVQVSINLSAVQLRDSGLVEALRTSIETHRIEPGKLELEITESTLMHSVESYLPKLVAIRALGVKLSIDDFGTGYSSLNYLNRFPIDRLKIDRSFVHDMLDDPTDLAITRAIIGLGHTLGLRVVAEGVETQQEVSILRDAGCDELQGYFFAKPLHAAQLAAWVNAQSLA